MLPDLRPSPPLSEVSSRKHPAGATQDRSCAGRQMSEGDKRWVIALPNIRFGLAEQCDPIHMELKKPSLRLIISLILLISRTVPLILSGKPQASIICNWQSGDI